MKQTPTTAPQRVLALLFTAVLAACDPAPGERPDDPGLEAQRLEAQRFAVAFLEQLDAGEIAETWPLVARNVQQRADEPTWTKVLGEAREAFGPLRSRGLRGYEFSEEVPEAPPGIYFVFDFDTSFATAEVVERVVCFLEGGERWRVAGYFTTRK